MLTATRSPFGDDRYLSRVEYQAGIGVDTFGDGSKHVAIAFSTNADGERKQSYVVTLRPSDFERVVREMMGADPEAAVKAFGAAMQDFRIP